MSESDSMKTLSWISPIPKSQIRSIIIKNKVSGNSNDVVFVGHRQNEFEAIYAHGVFEFNVICGEIVVNGGIFVENEKWTPFISLENMMAIPIAFRTGIKVKQHKQFLSSISNYLNRTAIEVSGIIDQFYVKNSHCKFISIFRTRKLEKHNGTFTFGKLRDFYLNNPMLPSLFPENDNEVEGISPEIELNMCQIFEESFYEYLLNLTDGINNRDHFPSTLLFVGDRHTGKSTRLRYTWNYLLTHQSKYNLSFLDCDVGQPEFTASGFLSLIHCQRSKEENSKNLSFQSINCIHSSSWLHIMNELDEKEESDYKFNISSKYYGYKSVSHSSYNIYMRILINLISEFNRRQYKSNNQTERSILLINTMGFIHHFGLNIIQILIFLTQCNQIIYCESVRRNEKFYNDLLNAEFMMIMGKSKLDVLCQNPSINYIISRLTFYQRMNYQLLVSTHFHQIINQYNKSNNDLITPQNRLLKNPKSMRLINNLISFSNVLKFNSQIPPSLSYDNGKRCRLNLNKILFYLDITDLNIVIGTEFLQTTQTTCTIENYFSHWKQHIIVLASASHENGNGNSSILHLNGFCKISLQFPKRFHFQSLAIFDEISDDNFINFYSTQPIEIDSVNCIILPDLDLFVYDRFTRNFQTISQSANTTMENDNFHIFGQTPFKRRERESYLNKQSTSN
ncbi:hypothetical protein SNEBB_010638 [Seison nebaliae]|nr:hypothetical protein SNEBB_010638 [Seison nebaliae]